MVNKPERRTEVYRTFDTKRLVYAEWQNQYMTNHYVNLTCLMSEAALHKKCEIPPTAVGGWLIRALQTSTASEQKSHRRSRWIVHTQPQVSLCLTVKRLEGNILIVQRLGTNNPPTPSLGFVGFPFSAF